MDASRLLADRYRLIVRISTSESGEMWRAHDEMLGRRVAVRLVGKDSIADEATGKRIAMEASAAALIAHPNIASVYDNGHATTENGVEELFFVTELIDGTSLAERFQEEQGEEERLSWRVVVEICAEAAAGLSSAHARGLVHRTVSPSTILVTLSGAKLTDLGVGLLKAPRGAQPTSPSLDVYALGTVLYQGLSGAPEGFTEHDIAAWLAADAPQSGPEVPPKVMAVCRACLDPNPANRPISAEIARKLAKTVRRKVAAVEPHMKNTTPTIVLEPVMSPASATVAVPGFPPGVAAGRPTGPGSAEGSETSPIVVPVPQAGLGPESGQERRPEAAASGTGPYVASDVASDVEREREPESERKLDLDLDSVLEATSARPESTSKARTEARTEAEASRPTPSVADAQTVMFGLGPIRDAIRRAGPQNSHDETVTLSAVSADDDDVLADMGITHHLRSRQGKALVVGLAVFLVGVVTAGVVILGGGDSSEDNAQFAFPAAATSSGIATSEDPGYHAGSSIMPTVSEKASPSASTKTSQKASSAPATTATTAKLTCSVAASVSQWGRDGLQIGLTISNTGSAAVNGWTLTFTMSERVTLGQVWNGTWSASGTTITVKNVSHNGQIAAGGTVADIGANMSGKFSNSVKASGFSLNGVSC